MLSVALRYVVARAVFEPTLKPILREHTDWGAAILFYLLYAVGIVVFAARPALANRSGRQAALYGLLFGFLAYMTYDVTNYATLSAWTVKLAVMDVSWGTFISGVAGLASYGVTRAVFKR